jgi:hypothetical protein
MDMDDGDELVPFQDVRLIRATAPALLCRIAQRSVWLPRGHIVGKLCCAGDSGTLFVRRWVARDRHLIDIDGMAIQSQTLSISRLPRLPARLHLVRREAETHLGN